MKRVRRGAAVLALAGVLCAASLAPSSTEAAWVDQEVGTGSFTAGVVSPVTVMSCSTPLLLLAPVTFSWTAPVGGLTRTGYRWTVTGTLTGQGTLLANATSVTVSSGLLGLGSGTFSLYAVGPGGWESLVKTGRLTFITGLISTCSVP